MPMANNRLKAVGKKSFCTRGPTATGTGEFLLATRYDEKSSHNPSKGSYERRQYSDYCGVIL